MIKRVLVPLDSSKFSETALDIACDIARIHASELTGQVIRDIPGITHSIGPVPAGADFYAKELQQKRMKKVEEEIDKLLEIFKKKCESEGVKYRYGKSQGMPSRKIVEKAMFFDLVVMGMKTFFQFETDEKHPGDSFEQVIMHSVTPILAVPAGAKIPMQGGDRAVGVICFDGSNEACRAMQRFAQFDFDDDMELHVVMSSREEEIAEDALRKAKDYLLAHDFKTVITRRTEEDIIKVVDRDYMDKAHIISIGVHIKKGIFDFMTGSLTRYLVSECRTPIFIGQ